MVPALGSFLVQMPNRDQPESDQTSRCIQNGHTWLTGPLSSSPQSEKAHMASCPLRVVADRGLNGLGRYANCPFLLQIKIVHDIKSNEKSKVFLCLSI